MIGNVLVGQSGGPTSVINSSLAGVYKTAVALGAKKVYGMRYGIEGFINGNYIDLAEYIKSDLDVELLKRTPSSYLGSCRYKMPEFEKSEAVYSILFKRFRELDIKYVFYIGGNDSMDTIKKLSAYAKEVGSDVRFVGVPKTIDNDLAITDHTPGFGSAAKFIATTIKEIARDSRVYDLDSVAVVEVMGRNAGWLTAAAALAESEEASGADLIYLPEKCFDVDSFIKDVSELKKTKKSLVIAVSEGIKTSSGKYISEGTTLEYSGGQDSFGHAALGGAAMTLSGIINRALGIKSRGIELSTLQRCASHISSRTDINEAYAVGADAVSRAVNGETGIMVTIARISDFPYQVTTGSADITKIANIEKCVPTEWILKNGKLRTDEVKRYISPLIEGEPQPVMVDGVPRHICID